MPSITAKQQITIDAPAAHVWHALTSPELISQYMFGAQVVSDWTAGSPIVYRGEWQGQPYEDKGEILEIDPPRLLKMTYYSPLGGAPDVAESYALVTYALEAASADRTVLVVSQGNNPDAAAVAQTEANWRMVLDTIKTLLEA